MSTLAPEVEQAPAPVSSNWAGAIGIEDEPTGDGRLINGGALRWDNLPVPLRYVSEDVGYHDGAVVVGTIDTLERLAGGVIWGTGRFDTSERAQEAQRLVGEHMMNGVSMDLDSVSFEVRVAKELLEEEGDEEGILLLAQETPDEADDDGRVVVAQMGSDDEMMVTTDGRVRAATLVAVPAFARAMIYLSDDPVLTAAADDADSAPEGGDDTASGDGQALWDDAMAALEAVDQLEFLSPEYLAATDAAGDLFAEAAIALNETDPALAATAAEVAAKLKRFASLPWGDPADVEVRESGPTADDESIVTPPPSEGDSLAASAAPVHPPEAWFADPMLDGPTPLVVTKDGRVYGHLATWDVCHVASPAGRGICITAPHSNRDYADFHLGTVLTAEDTLIGTGKITMGTGHAKHALSANATASHYDNTGTAVADIRAGEDGWGIWVAGALRPEVTPEQVRALRASPLSGDWREVAGNLELKAALAVNIPGFPIPRPAGMVASGGERLYTLVASGMLTPGDHVTPAQEVTLSAADVEYLHRVIHRNRVADAAALASEVRTIRNRQAVDQFAHSRKA